GSPASDRGSRRGRTETRLPRGNARPLADWLPRPRLAGRSRFPDRPAPRVPHAARWPTAPHRRDYTYRDRPIPAPEAAVTRPRTAAAGWSARRALRPNPNPATGGPHTPAPRRRP